MNRRDVGDEKIVNEAILNTMKVGVMQMARNVASRSHIVPFTLPQHVM